MSVMPVYMMIVALLVAPVDQLSKDTTPSYDRNQVAFGRDITTLTSLIPANMSATVLMPNLSQLGHKSVATKLLGDQHKNPYLAFKSSLEIVDGIDDMGAGAIGFIGDMSSADMWKNIVIWLPATNATAMMTFMQPISISANVYHLTVAGHASFAAALGDFLILSPTLETINACLKKQIPLAERLSAYQQQALRMTDLALVVTSTTSLHFDNAALENMWSTWLALMPGLVASATQVPLWTLSIKPHGLALSLVGHHINNVITPHNDIDNARQTLTSKNDLLVALPAESTVAAMGFSPNAAVIASSGFVDILFAFLQQQEIADTVVAQEIVRRLQHSVSRASNVSVAIQSPAHTHQMGRATIILQSKSESAVMRAEFQSMLSQIKRGFFKDPRYQRLFNRLQINTFASSHDGVRIDHISVDGINAGQSSGLSSMQTIIPRDGVVARMAVIDEAAFALVIGGDELDMQHVISRWRSHRTPLLSNATIVSYAAARRSPISAEGYVSSEAFRQTSGLVSHTGTDRTGGTRVGDESWATMSSYDVEVGVERFDIFLPFGWLDVFIKKQSAR